MTRVSALLPALALLGLSLASCVAPAEPPGAKIAVAVAPLSLPGVTDARYRLVITNGSGETVSDVELSADRYGDGAGSLSYVAPCDADDNDNTVSLTLLDLYQGGGAQIPPSTYTNPGEMSRQITCQANTDVSVTFDLTIARDASQGFFDIAVEFDQIFCSAKLDCLKDPGDINSTIELLFNGTQRARTFVVGFACTGGLGSSVETWQYLDDVQVSCGADTVSVDVGAGPGNLPPSAIHQLAGSHNPLFGAAVFQGDEHFASYDKQYWNIALGFDGGAGCHLSTRGTASNGELNASATPSGTTWPLITWDIDLTDAAGAQVCTQHPVNAATCPASGVCVGYTPIETPEVFDHAYYAAALPNTLAETYSFMTCGQMGRTGPNQATCDTAYQGTNLDGQVTVASGYQRWTVPVTTTYRITARGAQGGSTGNSLANEGGYGAEVLGEFQLNAGQELILLVGQEGADKSGCSDWGGGGGGGSFVARRVTSGDTLTPLSVDVTPLIIAAGGAGANDDMSGCSGQPRGEFDALATTSGTGAGGSAGSEGGGGGGYSGDGADSHGASALGFLNGGTAGSNGGYDGGFGGGGGPWNTGGGGGGYTGGSLDGYGQNGGYSYNSGANTSGSGGAHAGPGEVIIERLTSTSVTVSGALTEADPGRWSDGSVAQSCDAYLHPSAGHTAATSDGVYTIDPDGASATFSELPVYCDMTTDGGGWTKVESSTHPHFFSAGDWEDLNGIAPLSENYSALRIRSAFAHAGTFTYRLSVGDAGNWQSARDYFTVWEQAHDAFTASTDGSDYTLIAGQESTTCGGFNGLHDKYQGYSYATDADSGDDVNCWYMQVVPHTQYGSGNEYLDGYGGAYLHRVWQSLWLR